MTTYKMYTNYHNRCKTIFYRQCNYLVINPNIILNASLWFISNDGWKALHKLCVGIMSLVI